MKILILATMDENNVIGYQGKIPWYLPEDLVRFKELTNGHPTIMGRNVYDSIGGPLPGRFNIVCSRSGDFMPVRPAEVVSSLEAAIDLAVSRGYHEAYLIGGQSLYQEAIEKDLVDVIRITLIHDAYEGDSFFPDISSYGPKYILTYQEPGEAYSILDYTRNPFV
jgi:dihydrofolate reductase